MATMTAASIGGQSRSEIQASATSPSFAQDLHKLRRLKESITNGRDPYFTLHGPRSATVGNGYASPMSVPRSSTSSTNGIAPALWSMPVPPTPPQPPHPGSSPQPVLLPPLSAEALLARASKRDSMSGLPPDLRLSNGRFHGLPARPVDALCEQPAEDMKPSRDRTEAELRRAMSEERHQRWASMESKPSLSALTIPRSGSRPNGDSAVPTSAIDSAASRESKHRRGTRGYGRSAHKDEDDMDVDGVSIGDWVSEDPEAGSSKRKRDRRRDDDHDEERERKRERKSKKERVRSRSPTTRRSRSPDASKRRSRSARSPRRSISPVTRHRRRSVDPPSRRQSSATTATNARGRSPEVVLDIPRRSPDLPRSPDRSAAPFKLEPAPADFSLTPEHLARREKNRARQAKRQDVRASSVAVKLIEVPPDASASAAVKVESTEKPAGPTGRTTEPAPALKAQPRPAPAAVPASPDVKPLKDRLTRSGASKVTDLPLAKPPLSTAPTTPTLADKLRDRIGGRDYFAPGPDPAPAPALLARIDKQPTTPVSAVPKGPGSGSNTTSSGKQTPVSAKSVVDPRKVQPAPPAVSAPSLAARMQPNGAPPARRPLSPPRNPARYDRPPPPPGPPVSALPPRDPRPRQDPLRGRNQPEPRMRQPSPPRERVTTYPPPPHDRPGDLSRSYPPPARYEYDAPLPIDPRERDYYQPPPPGPAYDRGPAYNEPPRMNYRDIDYDRRPPLPPRGPDVYDDYPRSAGYDDRGFPPMPPPPSAGYQDRYSAYDPYGLPPQHSAASSGYDRPPTPGYGYPPSLPPPSSDLRALYDRVQGPSRSTYAGSLDARPPGPPPQPPFTDERRGYDARAAYYDQQQRSAGQTSVYGAADPWRGPRR